MKYSWRTRLGLSVILASTIYLSACSGLPAHSVSTAPATVAYMLGPSGSNTIVGFSTLAAGSGSPIATLHFSATYGVADVAADSSGNIYTASGNFSKGYVSVYPPNFGGASTASRTIDFGSYPNRIAIDPVGRVYVLNLPDAWVSGAPMTLAVYSAIANGTATPLRTLVLTNALPPFQDIAADSAGNIYVASYIVGGSNIAVYPPSANGPSLPSRTITFPPNSSVFGVAVDPAGDIFANVCLGGINGTNFAIEEFAPHASGAANPINTITLPIDTGWIFTNGGPVRLDGAGNIFTTLELSDLSNNGLFSHVLYGFAPTSTGNALPTVQITPPYSTFFAVN